MDMQNTGMNVVAKDISHSYTLASKQSVPVLNNANFAIPKGSFTIVFGPSGSGKSTLLNILSGLLKPSAGSLFYRGVDLYSYKPEQITAFRSKILGRVYQSSYWVKSLTAIENVALPLYYHGLSKKEALQVANASLLKLGMADYGAKYPTLLSGGEQQRVAIARALASDPELIVADEPTGNLDTKNSDTVVNLLVACQKKLGKTVVLVTHDLRYLSVADQLLQISDGLVTDVTGQPTESLMQSMVFKKDEPNEE